jgi:predicted metal-binding membrane protein
MAASLQYKNSEKYNRLSIEFIIVCGVAFVAGLSATLYFSASMGYEMEMPGGWKMSMMWMRMPGQTWFLSALSFLFMWLAMMVVMMMSSVLPMFLKTHRHWRSLCFMASGYFIIWLLAGIALYVPGAIFNYAAMHSPFLSRTVPLLSGTALIVVGTVQFTRWKMTHLMRCRSTYGCAPSCPQNETSFRLGCKQGLVCCACCSALMTIQVILGIMNLFVMAIVAIAITAEKLLPRPAVTARLAGIIAIAAGIVIDIHWIMVAV